MKILQIILGSAFILFGIIESIAQNLNIWIALIFIAIGFVTLFLCVNTKPPQRSNHFNSAEGASNWSGSDGGDCGGGGE